MVTNYAEAQRQFNELLEKAQKFDAVMEVISVIDPELLRQIGKDAMANKKLAAFARVFGDMI